MGWRPGLGELQLPRPAVWWACSVGLSCAVAAALSQAHVELFCKGRLCLQPTEGWGKEFTVHKLPSHGLVRSGNKR